MVQVIAGLIHLLIAKSMNASFARWEKSKGYCNDLKLVPIEKLPCPQSRILRMERTIVHELDEPSDAERFGSGLSEAGLCRLFRMRAHGENVRTRHILWHCIHGSLIQRSVTAGVRANRPTNGKEVAFPAHIMTWIGCPIYKYRLFCIIIFPPLPTTNGI